MWTANILDKGMKRDIINVQVEFSKEGVESDKLNFEGRTVEEIHNTINSQLKARTERDEDFLALKVGQFVPVEKVTEEVVEPTEEEVAKQVWESTKQKLSQALELREMAIKAGRDIDPQRQKDIDELAKFVDENFKNEYVE